MTVEYVQFNGPCPTCGHPVRWYGIPAQPGSGTTYTIGCDCPKTPVREAKPL